MGRWQRLWVVCALAVTCCTTEGSTRDEDPPHEASSADVALTVGDGAPLVPGRLLQRGQMFGATRWYHFLRGPLAAERLLAPPHQLGTLRYCIQELFDPPNQTREDFVASLPTRLEQMQDLELLEDFQARGGTVLVNFFGTPAWLTGPAVPSALCGDDWRYRPPADLDTWSHDVVVPIAAFFRDRLGPGTRFELWNEPTSCTFLGTTEQFLDMYEAFARAILSVDPTAKIGGPSHAISVLARDLVNDPAGPTDEPFVRRLIRRAASAPGGGVPLDFVTLHSFGVTPTTDLAYHEREVAQVRAWLDEHGFDAAGTEIINDEWNYGVYESLGGVNINTTHVNAAYVGMTMLAMDAAGYDSHATQALEDTGDDVVSPIFAWAYALPRPGYQVFELLSQLRGDQLTAHSSHPWVRAAAFRDGSEVLVFAASFAPSEEQSLQVAGTRIYDEAPGILAALTAEPGLAEELRTFLLGYSGALPPALIGALSESEVAAVVAAKAEFDQARAWRLVWGVGPGKEDPLLVSGNTLSWDLDVALPGTPIAISHARLDSKHGPTIATLTELATDLYPQARTAACNAAARIEALAPATACAGLAAYCDTGDTAGLGQSPARSLCAMLELFAVQFAVYVLFDNTSRALTEAGATALTHEIFASEFSNALEEFRPTWEAVWQRPEVTPGLEDVTARAAFARGVLRIPLHSEPFAVHLVRITLP